MEKKSHKDNILFWNYRIREGLEDSHQGGMGAALYFYSPLESWVTKNNSRLAGLYSYSCLIKNTYL